MKCTKSRSLPQKVRDIMSQKISGIKRENGIYHKKCKCGKEFESTTLKRKLCEECRSKISIQNYVTIEACRKGAFNSLSSRPIISKAEDRFSSLIPNGYVRNDRKLLNGLEIDYLYDNLAVEYHGAWHYKQFHDHYIKITKRDIEKHRRLIDLGYKHYIVGLAHSNKPKNFDNIHAYFISQLFEECSPFKFLYDLDIFKKEYANLKKTTGTSGYICLNTVNWYHSYRWFQKTSTHKTNAIDEWTTNKDRILKNRSKYSTLAPTDLRRYFLLFDHTPSLFSDITAKNLAIKITGNTIADPFAGYGNRLLGISSVNKKYIGVDINPYSHNANLIMSHDLQIDCKLLKGDSAKLQEKIECDGLITCPPYEDKDDYGYKSKFEFYDMIRMAFSNFIIKEYGFVIIKESLIDITKFKKALGTVIDSFELEWGGMKRSSKHTVLVIKN